MNKLAIVSLLMIFALGCKKGASVAVKDPGPYQAQAGEQIAESGDKNVSILVPGGWKRGGPMSSTTSMSETLGGLGEGTTGELGENMQNMAQGMAKDEAAMDATEASELEAKGILIWVNDGSRPIPGETRTHYSVKKTSGASSLEDAATAARDDITGESAPQMVEIPIGKAARFESKVTNRDGGEVFTIMYVVVNGEDAYQIKFVTQNMPSAVQSIEKQVIDSLRITPAKI